MVSVGAGVNPAHEYGNLEITNAIDYLFRNVQFLRFMGDVVRNTVFTPLALITCCACL